MKSQLLIATALSTCIASHALAIEKVVIIPDDYAGSPTEEKTELNRILLATAAGDSVAFIAAPSGKTITRVAFSDEPRFNNLNVRARYLQPAAKQLGVFIDIAAQARPAPGALHSQILLATTFDLGAEHFLTSGKRELLVIGSVRHDDPRDPGFSMHDDHWANDPLIHSNILPLGVGGRRAELAGVDVHLCATEKPGDFSSATAAAQIKRQWSVSVDGMGGRLVTYALGDLQNCVARALQENVEPVAPYTPDKTDTRPEMRFVERQTVPLDANSRPAAASAVPAETKPPAALPRKKGAAAQKPATETAGSAAKPKSSKEIPEALRHFLPQPLITTPCGPSRAESKEKTAPAANPSAAQLKKAVRALERVPLADYGGNDDNFRPSEPLTSIPLPNNLFPSEASPIRLHPQSRTAETLRPAVPRPLSRQTVAALPPRATLSAKQSCL